MAEPNQRRRIFCTYEDRADNLTGVRLMVRSLLRYHANAEIVLYSPRHIADMVRSRLGELPVQFRTLAQADTEGWDVKPHVLSAVLRDGADEAVWVDTDIIFTSSISGLLETDAFVGSEEQPWRRNGSSRHRTKLFGLAFEREIGTVNSCFLRVRAEHHAILDAWIELLDGRLYRESQSKPMRDRQAGLVGDQDPLTAVLSSSLDPHLYLLKCGQDIAQCHLADGYSVSSRLRNLRRGLPSLVHAQGEKPWMPGRRPAFLQLSPFRYAALEYRHALPTSERSWLRIDGYAARSLHMVTMGNPNLAGILPAFLRMTARRIYRLLRP